MAQCFGPPQSARTDALGTFYPSLEPVDSSTPRSAPLPRCTLLRHSSFVRAVCVDALVRICAGCALKAHGVQFPEMETAAKPSSQPRTKSCRRLKMRNCVELPGTAWVLVVAQHNLAKPYTDLGRTMMPRAGVTVIAGKDYSPGVSPPKVPGLSQSSGFDSASR